MTATASQKPLPAEIDIHDVRINEALLLLADCLRELASSLPLISDVQLDLVLEEKRSALHFRCYR